MVDVWTGSCLFSLLRTIGHESQDMGRLEADKMAEAFFLTTCSYSLGFDVQGCRSQGVNW